MEKNQTPSTKNLQALNLHTHQEIFSRAHRMKQTPLPAKIRV